MNRTCLTFFRVLVVAVHVYPVLQRIPRLLYSSVECLERFPQINQPWNTQREKLHTYDIKMVLG